MQIYDEMFILGIFIGIVFLGTLVVLTILINNHFTPPIARPSEKIADERFNPLAWATTFFSIWYTLLIIQSNQIFAWVCFGVSVVLLISIYCKRLKRILSSPRFIDQILPTIFIITVALFIVGVILALKDLSNIERIIALSLACVVLGTYLAIGISRYKMPTLRIIICVILSSVFIALFIYRFKDFGFGGNWPLILLVVQSIWATVDPDRFKDIPLV